MKEYDHKKLEKKWQSIWEKKKIYKTKDNFKKKKFYILDMFPYVSGEGIHVGHPKGYIATDVVSRMKRMQGFNVLHPMGFDAFGLPAENYAIKTKTNPTVSVSKNITRFKKQLKIIGFDYDWSREVSTSDPKFYKWTQWIFLKLLEKGLAYQSNEPVNWCPTDKTVLANEDVEDGKCERCGTIVEKKPIRQWVLKITDYADRLLSDLDELDWPESIKESQRNWIGRSKGAEISFQIIFKNRGKPGLIPVFTTRPDTIFGATYLVLSPEHPWVTLAIDDNHKGILNNALEVRKYIEEVKKKTDIERNAENKEKTGVELKGVKAINPANNEEIPVWIADYVLASYGTGAIMAVPAHDERDFQFAKKYKLPFKRVVEPKFIGKEGEGAVKKGLEFIKREAVAAVVRNPKDDSYLCISWKNILMHGLVTGGIENGEDIVETAKREILEETGYKNLKLVKISPHAINTFFYHRIKKQNRWAHFQFVFFDLIDEEREAVDEKEFLQHEVVWKNKNELENFFTVFEGHFIINLITKDHYIHIGDGLLYNSGKFDGMDSEKAKKEIVKFVGGEEKVTFKLRDWVFSRQRYWGEPIPVLHDGGEVISVKEKDLPVKLPKVKSYEPTGTAESPLANVPNWINVKIGKKVLRRESNTMPQWAGSSWYYLRYMDPNNNKALVDKKKEKYWNMVDLYVGGAEHATRHLIYARFWHKFLYDIGVVANKEPFKRLQHVGLIIATDGRKMSKRFGNIINPDSIISTFGADSLRLYEMFMGPFDQSVSWSTDSLVGPRRFLERVWKTGSKLLKFSSPSVTKLLNKTIKKVSEDISSMHFNTAVSTLMILLNEMDAGGVGMKEYKKFLQILAPFAPHITEELWQTLGEKESIHISSWPEWDKDAIIDEEIKIVVQINGKVRAEIKISAEASEEDVKKEALRKDTVKKYTEGKEIKRIIYVKNKLINIVL